MQSKSTGSLRFLFKTAYIAAVFCSLQSIANANSQEDARPSATGEISNSTQSTTNTGVDARSRQNTSQVDITFGGSLCPVCLMAFQRRLQGTDGVLNAKVESIPGKSSEHSAHPPKRAHVVIEFASDKITKSDLETMVRQNDFQFINTQVRDATKPES